MAIRVERVGDVHVVEMEGDFTIGSTALSKAVDLQGNRLGDLHETLHGLMDQGHRQILLDLTNVKFMDSAGLGELVSAKKKTMTEGGDIKLLNPSRRVHDLLSMVRLTDIFDIHQDRDTALASFARS
jgi:anti-sigma B factor antagonist